MVENLPVSVGEEKVAVDAARLTGGRAFGRFTSNFVCFLPGNPWGLSDTTVRGGGSRGRE
jgi:hypothetical protein